VGSGLVRLAGIPFSVLWLAAVRPGGITARMTTWASDEVGFYGGARDKLDADRAHNSPGTRGRCPAEDHDCLRTRDQRLTDVGTLPRGTAGRGSRAGLWSAKRQAPYENTSVRVGPTHRCTELHFPGRSRLSPAK
jgi:hypothetical protein